MEAKEAKRWLLTLINVRLRLMQKGASRKNNLECSNICQRLKLHLNAYPYDGIKIFNFIDRHYNAIHVIIPQNGSEERHYKTLEKCRTIARNEQ